MPLPSFLDENRGNILVKLSFIVWRTFSCFSLKFIVVALFLFLSQKHRRALNFRLDFLIKECKMGVWFIVYLMQDFYQFILLFPKTILFLAMLLVCGGCYLYLQEPISWSMQLPY